ncbi:hypothetical protein [Raoultella sp. C349492]|uniref:hypothetical protein n=1 Tax=Raoultella sp. C349492 TaxID=2970253 RepID=UPI0035C67B98
MSKTEQNIEIAKLATELMKAVKTSSSNTPYAGISDDLNAYNPPMIEVFDALYDRLKKQLAED